jgi:hypothetical protein
MLFQQKQCGYRSVRTFTYCAQYHLIFMAMINAFILFHRRNGTDKFEPHRAQ